ncbi:class I SAM-dependent rRNA methyltransferase [Fusobacterium sp. PH5-44]|uniref:class I SAM-dependent rRNA methyltransferase n=1 Tax=unclassified Fusobacterium TaxID=2648384 RepID=UPI003D206F08
MKKICLIKNKEKKVLNFYPNIYLDDIKNIPGNLVNGEIVELVDIEGMTLGTGYVTLNTSSVVRVLTLENEKIDQKFFTNKIEIAYNKRLKLLEETNSFRGFYSEGDGIPGLIIDYFDKYLSVQFRNSGIEYFKNEIINSIKKVYKPKGIYERSDIENRVIEGVEQNKGIIYGDIPDKVLMIDNGVKYNVDIVNGQKTGFFLDQRESRKFIKNYITNKTKFLDVFSSSGGFAMRALKDGAASATLIDKDSHALSLSNENYLLNQVSGKFSIKEGDALMMLNTLVSRNEKYDIITLDPPTIVKKRLDVKKGRDFFYDLCDKSFKLLDNNGILGVITCSYYITLQDLIEVTRMAASNNRKMLQVIGVNYQPEDHPWILHIPETLYLKALWVKIS